MMDYLGISIFMLLFIYAGQIAGLAIHCDNSDLLKPAKRYVYVVPVLTLIVWLGCIKDSVAQKKWSETKALIIIPHKNFICLQAVAQFAAINLVRIKSVKKSNMGISCSQLLSIRRGAESFFMSDSKQYSTYI